MRYLPFGEKNRPPFVNATFQPLPERECIHLPVPQQRADLFRWATPEHNRKQALGCQYRVQSCWKIARLSSCLFITNM